MQLIFGLGIVFSCVDGTWIVLNNNQQSNVQQYTSLAIAIVVAHQIII